MSFAQKVVKLIKDKLPDKQRVKLDEVREAYRKSGRKDWNAFQKEYKEKRC